MSDIVPDFGEPEECAWCGEGARGVTRCRSGWWAPSCHRDGCDEGGPYRGAA